LARGDVELELLAVVRLVGGRELWLGLVVQRAWAGRWHLVVVVVVVLWRER